MADAHVVMLQIFRRKEKPYKRKRARRVHGQKGGHHDLGAARASLLWGPEIYCAECSRHPMRGGEEESRLKSQESWGRSIGKESIREQLFKPRTALASGTSYLTVSYGRFFARKRPRRELGNPIESDSSGGRGGGPKGSQKKPCQRNLYRTRHPIGRGPRGTNTLIAVPQKIARGRGKTPRRARHALWEDLKCHK